MKRLLVVFIIVLISGCDLSGNLGESALGEFETYALTSYYMLRDYTEEEGRTTINVVGNTGGFEGGYVADFPEKGQTTLFDVYDRGSGYYQIRAITTYPVDSPVFQTWEEYRVHDLDGNGIWNEHDPVVDSSDAVDSKYRFDFTTYLKDSTRREEVIVSDLTADSVNYKEASLSEYAFPASETEMIETGQTMQWSSKVAFSLDLHNWSETNFWASYQQKRIIGLRYYAEYVDDNGDLVQSYTIFEKILNGNGAGIDDATAEKMFGASGFKELALFRMNVKIVDGVKSISGKWFLYETKKVRQDITLEPGIELEIVD